MKLHVLVDNNTYIDQYYYGEPAVSFYIEDEGTKLLFDVGYSDLYIQNAQKLHLPLNEITTIAISHGHNDHTGGLAYLPNASGFDFSSLQIVAHPDTFDQKVLDDLEIGSPISKERLSQVVSLSLTTTPIKLSPNITYLGEIPRVHSFENTAPIGQCCCNNASLKGDYLLDDTALAYQSPEGLYIITGCSHSGICNIIEHAKKVCHCDTILGVIGGFHLFDVDTRLEHTIDYFKKHSIQTLYPCHCVSFKVKAAIHHHIPIHEVGVGLEVNW